MPTVVAVRFKEASKMYHFSPGTLTLHRLDKVVVETAAGLSMGRVVMEPVDKDAAELPSPLRRVVRKANGDDLRREAEARVRASQVLERCRRKVREGALPLRPVEADATLDGTRVTITFTAEERVDTRALARALSAEMHCRIELRQVGARDEAKALDGIGPCGQRLCCARWLTEFKPVSIKMAKLQHLALNPGKLAGVCGRLKCCLRYEIENYEGGARPLPAVGSNVFTAVGEGRVVAIDAPQQRVSVLLDEPAPRWFPAEEVFSHNGCADGGACSNGECVKPRRSGSSRPTRRED
jgi:cell fate regulator YaaT (PSP1 superfamily)